MRERGGGFNVGGERETKKVIETEKGRKKPRDYKMGTKNARERERERDTEAAAVFFIIITVCAVVFTN